jgi:hypothetical protein
VLEDDAVGVTVRMVVEDDARTLPVREATREGGSVLRGLSTSSRYVKNQGAAFRSLSE